MIRTLSLPQRHKAKNEFSPQERSVIRFATWQLFILLYLEKFAIGPVSFQINVPMAVMFVCLMYLLVQRRISLSPVRMGLYLVFVGCSILSQNSRQHDELDSECFGTVLDLFFRHRICTFV